MTEEELNLVIRQLDDKIRALQIARRVVIEEFGKGLGIVAVRPSLFIEEPRPKRGETRKDVVIRLLREHGPMKATEIRDRAGLSKGTVGWVLSQNKDVFRSLGDGRWDLIKEKE